MEGKSERKGGRRQRIGIKRKKKERKKDFICYYERGLTYPKKKILKCYHSQKIMAKNLVKIEVLANNLQNILQAISEQNYHTYYQ